jgi:ammonia channel protein AmtB
MGDGESPSSCINTGDTTWVLVSTILVLGMMPALAFFEAGLLRSKNTLSLVTQIFGGLIVTAFMWDVSNVYEVMSSYRIDIWIFIGIWTFIRRLHWKLQSLPSDKRWLF